MFKSIIKFFKGEKHNLYKVTCKEIDTHKIYSYTTDILTYIYDIGVEVIDIKKIDEIYY